MVEKVNKYWFVHGGFSFYNLDTRAHNLAVDTIWEAMTSHASIYYHLPITIEELDSIRYDISIVSKTASSISIQWKIFKWEEVCVTCFFTFVKVKFNLN